MATCGATATAHCCHLGPAGVCPYFDPAPPPEAGGHCSLRRQYRSWETTYFDPRYSWVKEQLVSLGYSGMNCGDYPRRGEHCNTCGVTG